MATLTKRYAELKQVTLAALDEHDGWRAARATHEAVDSLRRHLRLGKIEALDYWQKELNRPRFGFTSARRYYDIWDRYGVKESRLSDHEGNQLTFAEHYAVIRGGQRALDVMDEARRAGTGIHVAVQKMTAEEDESRTIRLAGKIQLDLARLLEMQTENGGPSEDEAEFLKEFTDIIYTTAHAIKRLVE